MIPQKDSFFLLLLPDSYWCSKYNIMGGGTSAAQQSKNLTTEGDFYANYSVSRELGSGAFSVVKMCQNLTSKVNFAVKIVNKASLQDDDAASLLVEIKILKSLDHPNIIKYCLHCLQT